MCLIALAWQCHPRYRLALIANRDEFHARPATPAEFATDAPDVYGGRDLQKGGGWLQVSTRQRLAAVTNVRAGPWPEPAMRSRGELVHDFVRGTAPGVPESLSASANEFGRYNLLAWEGAQLYFVSNYPQYLAQPVTPGLHRLSNAALDEDWPKALRAQAALQAWLASADACADEPTLATLLAALGDRERAPDAELPDTGVGIELERLLSSPFIVGDNYGTRSSSVVLIDDEGIDFHESRFGPGGLVMGETRRHLPFAR